MLISMNKSQPLTMQRKNRRAPRKAQRPVILPAGLPLGTQQALMGLAAFEARHP